MKNITPEFAEILGLLCAEGCHVIQYSSFWGKDRGKQRYYKNKKSERIEFYNKDLNLLKHLQSLLQISCDYSSSITKDNKINICNRNVIRQIINQTELGFQKWKVSDSIKQGSNLVKIRFIRGYFDGDGTASNNIRFFSSNKSGLLEVLDVLKDLGFCGTFQGPIIREGRKPSYIIQISNKQKETFLNEVKPISKRPD